MEKAQHFYWAKSEINIAKFGGYKAIIYYFKKTRNKVNGLFKIIIQFNHFISNNIITINTSFFFDSK
tara:strand:+ start:1048 stop:1248 length:201 start_codon:yes stop_codon:yes gene_type:complete